MIGPNLTLVPPAIPGVADIQSLLKLAELLGSPAADKANIKAAADARDLIDQAEKRVKEVMQRARRPSGNTLRSLRGSEPLMTHCTTHALPRWTSAASNLTGARSE